MTSQGSAPLPDLFGRATIVLRGHEGLRGAVEEMRTLCAGLRAEAPVAFEQARGPVDAFLDHLMAHFAAEESPDYFGALVLDSFGIARSVERLIAEHVEMRKTITALRDFANPGRRRIEFAVLLERLLDDFTAHERGESAAIQEFLRPSHERTKRRRRAP
ncbi:MAG TPA: hemerythrin domain-containing protein [Polyangiaceae bacterium]|nr:hemerythrin domain-containing protein [Polyangiaceae bacterium]